MPESVKCESPPQFRKDPPNGTAKTIKTRAALYHRNDKLWYNCAQKNKTNPRNRMHYIRKNVNDSCQRLWQKFLAATLATLSYERLLREATLHQATLRYMLSYASPSYESTGHDKT